MRITVFLLLLLLFVGCTKKDHGGKTPLVEVSGETLYQEDLAAVAPSGLSKDDSLLFAENYIKNWIEDVLIYSLAETNVPNSEEIDQLTENYRKSLVVHTYQQALINQRLSKELTEEELLHYYESNKELFILDQPLIKGLYIKVPITSSGLANVRNWYKNNTSENIEALEKYSLNNAVSYDYFYDKWTLASDVMDKIPLDIENVNEYLKNHKNIEVKDEEFYYFLNIAELLQRGEQKPYEFAQKEIRSLLKSQKQVSFIKEMKTDLYKKALNNNKITYYY